MGKALQGYRKLFEGLKKGEPQRLYLLYGPEEYLKKEFVREVLSRALPEVNRAFNLDILYGDEFDRSLFDDRLGSFPLFTEQRVVILKNFDSLSPSNKDHVIAAAERVSDAMVFVVESSHEKLDNARLRNLGKVADAKGLSAPFPLLDDQETIERVTARCRREGFTIDPDALDLLVESVGTELMDLGNEVDKVLLSVPEGGNITRELVSEVVGKYRSESMFSLLDQVSRRQPGALVRSLDGLIDAGEEPVFVLAMLLKRVVLLLQTTLVTAEQGRAVGNDRALASALGGISPYYATKLRSQALRFKPDELERLLDNLRWADIKLKTTQSDPKTILEEALLAAHLRKTLASTAA